MGPKEFYKFTYVHIYIHKYLSSNTLFLLGACCFQIKIEDNLGGGLPLAIGHGIARKW